MDVKKRAVCIRYMDHILFRNADPHLFKPVIREAIGWIIKEDDHALYICFDKTVERLPHEKPSLASGIVILKSDILEIIELV